MHRPGSRSMPPLWMWRLELLSRRYRVIAPWHPGYGNSPLIDGSGSVDDLAYLYLDLAGELGIENAVPRRRLLRRLGGGGDDDALDRQVLASSKIS